MNPYESTTLLDQYLLFHYGTPAEISPPTTVHPAALEFPRQSVALAPPSARQGTALDLGCAVGRSTFELSRTCSSVVGIDFSSTFINAADRIRSIGQLPYRRHEEGHISEPLVARRPEGTHPDRVRFDVGDATALPADIGSFDFVHAANLICRLRDPQALLERLPSLVKSGGHLVLTTPCTWLGEFTPPENWPKQPTLRWLQANLEPSFALLDTRDIPFLIRETARKFQCSTAQGSLWKRR